MADSVLTLTQLLGKPDFQPPKRMDVTAQQAVMTHVKTRRSFSLFPITTDDLTTLIEKHVAELDVYADLATFGPEVEGMTLFQPAAKPIVQISGTLSEARNENRLRSTLAHEFGHVLLHDPVFQRRTQQPLFDSDAQYGQICYRDGFESQGPGDLFEYQAWYFCGALLLPMSELASLVADKAALAGSYGEIWQLSPLGQEIIDAAAQWFGVSKALARIRLLKSCLLVEAEPSPALF